MQRNRRNLRPRVKSLFLSGASAGILLVSFCSAVDVKHNIVSGTMSFLEDYTADLWAALVPPADQILPGRGG